MRWILAVLAISYLLVMANHELLRHVDGDGLDAQHTHNQKQSDGLIVGEINDLSGIEIRDNEQQWELLFDNAQWQYKKENINADNLKLLQELLSMLTRSEPVRTFLPEDLAHSAGDLEADYGLAEPKLEVSVFMGLEGSARYNRQTLTFGHATPDGSLHYVRKAGDPALYVMSGFLYQQARMLVRGLGGSPEN